MEKIIKFPKSRHPKEMYLVALIEMCQRFAFWGVGNLLVLYLVGHFKYSDARADHLYGIYSGIAFVLPLLGGFIADKTSHFKSVILGSIFTMVGCLFIAFGEQSFLYLGLFFAAIGAALFTPSIYTLLGRIYHERHHLREGGFSVYYASVNLGVFLATISMGALGGSGRWKEAFILAALIQLLGLILFFFVKNQQVFQASHSLLPSAKKDVPLNKIDKSRISLIVILSLISIVLWIAYNQGWSSMSLFILNYTQREIGSMTFAPSWILSSESFFLVVLAFPLSWLYRFLAKYKKDPDPIMKTVLSFFCMAFCFLVMSLAAEQIPAGAKTASVSFYYPIGAYFFMALAEMLLAPIGLSLVTHLSPRKYTAFLVGFWYVCVGIANYAGGLIAGWMTNIGSIKQFFDIFTLSCVSVAVVLGLFSRLLDKMRHCD